MNLPNLPKKIRQDEARFGLKFRKWVEENYKSLCSCTFETKDTRGKDYLSFSEVSQDQINAGMRVKSDKGDLSRIQVGTIGTGDYHYYRNAQAFLIVKYPKGWEMIDMETFVMEIKRSKKRRSLTYQRAKEISILSV